MNEWIYSNRYNDTIYAYVICGCYIVYYIYPYGILNCKKVVKTGVGPRGHIYLSPRKYFRKLLI